MGANVNKPSKPPKPSWACTLSLVFFILIGINVVIVEIFSTVTVGAIDPFFDDRIVNIPAAVADLIALRAGMGHQFNSALTACVYFEISSTILSYCHEEHIAGLDTITFTILVAKSSIIAGCGLISASLLRWRSFLILFLSQTQDSDRAWRFTLMEVWREQKPEPIGRDRLLS